MFQRPFAFFRRAGPAGAVLLLAAGCAAVPELGPAGELRSSSSIGAERTLTPTGEVSWPSRDWWSDFGDPQLTALIEEGLANAPDLAAASARVRRAAAMALEAGAARFPSIDAQASAYRERRSLNTGFSDEIRRFLPRGWRSGAEAAVEAGYEIDVWGRNRAALAAATSEARAAAVDMLETRLMLTTAIGLAYADLGELFAQRDIRDAALRIRLTSRDLVANRFANGLETRGSLRQADAEVAAARANLAAADEQIELRRNQIAALLGAGPDRGLAISRPRITSAVGEGLPQDVTTGLLGRRPDIVSARERVEAAARRIDVARADFFPAIRLDALIGLQSLGIGRLIESDSSFGRAGPALSLPIFRGGAIRGRYKAAHASYDELVAMYNGTVVDAYRQVADIVTSRAAAGKKLAHAREALEASEEAYSVAMLRYKGGLSGYLDALAVEDRLVEARLTVARIEADARSLDIALIRALGGGFRNDVGEPVEEMLDG